MAGKLTRRHRRGKQSRIQQLPPDIKSMLDRLLRQHVSQQDILARLQPLLTDAGEPPVSRSALSRYAVRMEQSSARMQEAEAVAKACVGDLDEKSNLGRLITNMLRTLTFDLIVDIDPSPENRDETTKAIKDLALAAQRVERAEEMTVKREREIRREVAAQAETEAKKRGISGDTAAALRRALQEAA